MQRDWIKTVGFFNSGENWSAAGMPVAGDNLYAASGWMSLTGVTFGSAAVKTTIGLTSDTASGAPTFSMRDVTLKNVQISEAPRAYVGPMSGAPADYYAVKYGVVRVAGTVTNDGGTIEAGREARLQGNLSIVIAPGATLANKGVLLASAYGQLTISGGTGSTLQNSNVVNAAGGKVTISAHVTGTGTTTIASAGFGLTSQVELNAAVDAGQTFHLQRGALQIDQPLQFLGKVDLGGAGPGGGFAQLEGLAASSWDVKGSLVELFGAAGNRLDTLQLTSAYTSSALHVYRTTDGHGAGVMVATDPSFATTGSVVLPYHATAA